MAGAEDILMKIYLNLRFRLLWSENYVIGGMKMNG